MSIALHIERLVIDEAVLGGERAADVRLLLERELAHRLAQPGALDALRGTGAVTALPAAAVPAPARGQERLGSCLAMAVGQSLSAASMAQGSGGSGHG